MTIWTSRHSTNRTALASLKSNIVKARIQVPTARETSSTTQQVCKKIFTRNKKSWIKPYKYRLELKVLRVNWNLFNRMNQRKSQQFKSGLVNKQRIQEIPHAQMTTCPSLKPTEATPIPPNSQAKSKCKTVLVASKLLLKPIITT